MLSWILAVVFAVAAPANVAGTWRVQFVTPNGEAAVTMTLNQDGEKLSGRIVDEYGEYVVNGSVADDQVTVSWSVVEEGKPLQITMKGTIDGEYITGVARLGNVGEGSLEARRTSRNP
jgi:hypothetical protein